VLYTICKENIVLLAQNYLLFSMLSCISKLSTFFNVVLYFMFLLPCIVVVYVTLVMSQNIKYIIFLEI